MPLLGPARLQLSVRVRGAPANRHLPRAALPAPSHSPRRACPQSPVQGAQSALFASTAPQLRGKGGTYIGPLYATNTGHAHERLPVNRAAYDYVSP